MSADAGHLRLPFLQVEIRRLYTSEIISPHYIGQYIQHQGQSSTLWLKGGKVHMPVIEGPSSSKGAHNK